MHINAQDMLGITVAFTRQLVREVLKAGAQDSGDVYFTEFFRSIQIVPAENVMEEEEAAAPPWEV